MDKKNLGLETPIPRGQQSDETGSVPWFSGDFEISCIECDAILLFNTNVYDDNGNVIGQISEEEAEKQMDSLRGHRYLDVSITHKIEGQDKRRRLKGPVYLPSEQSGNIRMMSDAISQVLAHRVSTFKRSLSPSVQNTYGVSVSSKE